MILSPNVTTGVAISYLRVAALSVFCTLVIATGLYIHALKTELSLVQGQLAAEISRSAKLESANAEFALKVEAQNASIRDYEAKAQQATSEATAAIAKAKQEASVWRSRYKSLLTVDPSSAGGVDVAGAMLDQYLETRREEASKR